jgi:hypothetical protein
MEESAQSWRTVEFESRQQIREHKKVQKETPWPLAKGRRPPSGNIRIVAGPPPLRGHRDNHAEPDLSGDATEVTRFVPQSIKTVVTEPQTDLGG